MRRRGFEPEEVLSRVEQVVRPRTFERVWVADPEPAMCQILRAEIAGEVRILEQSGNAPAAGVVVALAARLPRLRSVLPEGLPIVPLRLRSVRGSIEGQSRPPAQALVAIVSHSAEIRYWARAMLLAVGLDGPSLCEVDAAIEGWRDRLGLASIVVTDALTSGALTERAGVRVFRVISDASLADLKRMCGRVCAS